MSNEKELLNDNIVNEELNENEELSSTEEALNYLALEEEIKRIENFNKDFEVTDCVKKEKYYEKGMVQAETLIAMMKAMVGQGIDYSNAIQICSNYMTNEYNLELNKMTCEHNERVAKVQQIQAQQSQI